MRRASAAPQNNRVPVEELLGRVHRLFVGVSRIRTSVREEVILRNQYLLTASTKRPSHHLAMIALGLDPSSYSRWKKGNPTRDGVFTERLHDLLQGVFFRIDDLTKRGIAEKIWAIFSSIEANSQAISELHAMVELHREKLWADDAQSPVLAASKGDTVPQEIRGTASPTVNAGSVWSEPWTSQRVGGWARGLLRRSNRIAYVYGARLSGKSVLITSLEARLASEAASSTRLHLSVRDLIVEFRTSGSRRAVHLSILNQLLHQLQPGAPGWTLGEYYDFDDEMIKVLARARAGQIYLFVASGDACLRVADAQNRAGSIDATKQLFSFFRPMAEESAHPTLNRMSVVIEGSRPLADVARLYPASPLNVARSYVLPRLDRGDCMELARLAGIEDDGDIARLFVATGGHRSLVWALLRGAAENDPGTPLPSDLSSPGHVPRVIAELHTELDQQPQLAEALRKVITGERIDLESRTRLRDAMYIASDESLCCDCPLLEATFQKALP